MAAKRELAESTDQPFDPGPAVVKEHGNELGAYLGDEKHEVSIERANNPSPNASFGFTGTVVHVESDADSLDGVLALRFDPDGLGPVIRDSLRLFRWDEDTEWFSLVGGSRVSIDGDYAWASIGRPGRYTLIGLNAHPGIIETIQTLCHFNDVFETIDVESGHDLKDDICKVILCRQERFDQLQERETFEELARRSGRRGFPIDTKGGIPPPLPGGGSAENVCEHCLGGDGGTVHAPPECEIITDGGLGGCTDEGWVSEGPANLSGCVEQVVVDPSNSKRLYAAARNGGAWRLDDIDQYPLMSWQPVSDQLEDIRMRSIAVAPGDDTVVYAMNGLEYLYRSPDRGANWSRTSTTKLGREPRILVHPSDPDTVFVASKSGFRVSFDGGENWLSPLYSGTVLDAVMDPLDSSIIYLGVQGTGVVKTTTMGFDPDGWETVLQWSEADSPVSSMITIALGYRNADGSLQVDSDRTVAAKFGNETFLNQHGGRDTGSGWTSKGKRGWGGQGQWCHAIAIDPYDPDVILAGQQRLFRTEDGGDTWNKVADFYKPHEDQQSIAFDRQNQDVVYLSNDGGVYRSTDGGETWYVPENTLSDEIAARRSLVADLTTAEFYRVGVQGNGAVGNLYHQGIIASNALSSRMWRGLEGHAWEFRYIYADPKRPARYYVFANKLLRRRYPETGSDDFAAFGRFTPFTSGGNTNNPVGSITVDTRPSSDVILVGAEADPSAGTDHRLMKTTEGDKEPTKDADGNWTNLPTWTVAIDNGNDPVVSVAMAPSEPGMAYAMSRSGSVFHKLDVATDDPWNQPGGWPTTGVRQLAIDATTADRLYAITDDEVGRSEDGGETWTTIGGPLPETDMNSILAHPDRANEVYVGGDVGVFRSRDAGDTWTAYDDDLPNAQVLQLLWSGNALRAVTHGRGLWRREPC